MIIDETLGNATTWQQGVRHALRALKRRLTLTDNLQCRVIEVADTGLANTTFTVDHDLGRVPIAYFWNVDRSATIYDVTKGSWTTSQMTLKCSVANAAATLVVF